MGRTAGFKRHQEMGLQWLVAVERKLCHVAILGAECVYRYEYMCLEIRDVVIVLISAFLTLSIEKS